MSEHHPDMDLIMALAAGDLPPEEAARAEAGLDAEARAELAAQRAALEALEGLPRPTLSSGEQQRLRAAVRTELRLDTTPIRVARRRRTRSPLARALPALAAFASLIVVLAVALDFGVESESEPAASFEAPATTAAATTGAPAVNMVVTETTAAAAEAAEEEEATAEQLLVAAEETEVVMEEAAAAVDEVAAEEAAPMRDEATTTTVGDASQSAAATAAPATTTTSTTVQPDAPSLAFDFSTARPADAVGLISGAIAEGSEVPFPVSDLAGRAVSQGLACGEIAASGSGPDDTVYFMAYGLVDGEDAEAYLILENGAGDADPGPAAGIEPGDLLLLTRPDCEAIAFSTP